MSELEHPSVFFQRLSCVMQQAETEIMEIIESRDAQIASRAENKVLDELTEAAKTWEALSPEELNGQSLGDTLLMAIDRCRGTE